MRCFRFRFFSFPPYFLPGFPCILSGFSYLALLYVSFRPSLFRSHSCSTGAYLCFRSGIFRFRSCILSSADLSLPATWLTVSSVPLIRVFCLTAASSLLAFCFRFRLFLFRIRLVSHASLPILCTWLSVCFLSSFPASLPRLFRWCSSFISSGCVSLTFCFLSSASVLGSDYSAFCFFRSVSSCFRLSVATSVRCFRFRFFSFPPSFQPGFPCFLSGFLYLAFRSFPFILPGFAPTTVPPVLTLHCFRVFVLCFLLSFVRFGFRI